MPDNNNSEYTPEEINKAALEQGEKGEKQLQLAIGAQIREFRLQLKMTVVEVAKQAGVSQGMLYKVKRGVTAPSLGILYAIMGALIVTVTSLFRRYEEQRDCSFVRAGEGLLIEPRGTLAGHLCQ